MPHEFEYQFTLFTATYNRAHTLPRVFESLCSQTYKNFEWIIGDDGSEDNTQDLIEEWQEIADFSIKYFRIEHSGKHFVFNQGVKIAKGEFFAEIDSDDALKPEALEIAYEHWNEIPTSRKGQYFAICFACETEKGERVGKPFNTSPIDIDYRKFNYSKKYRSEKWRCFQTNILTKFPFEESEVLKDTLIPESIVFCEIAKTHKARFSNKILRIYYQDVPSLCRRPVHPMINLEGLNLARLYTINNDLEFLIYKPLELIKRVINYARFSFHLKITLPKQINSLKTNIGKILWISLLPVATSRYLFDLLINNTPNEARKAKQRLEKAKRY